MSSEHTEAREGIRFSQVGGNDLEDGRSKLFLYIEEHEPPIYKFDVVNFESRRRIGRSINIDDVFQQYIDDGDFSSIQDPEHRTIITLYAEEKAAGVDKTAKTYRFVNASPNEVVGMPGPVNFPGMAGILTKDKSDLNIPLST